MDLEGKYWTTKELNTSGMGRYQIAKAVKEGDLTRVSRGLYMGRDPVGLELLAALRHRYPELVFSGHTAMSLYGYRSTLMQPVQAIVPKGHRVPASSLVEARQSRMGSVAEVQGFPVVSVAAAVAADTQLNRVDRWKALEQSYSGFTGRERFDADKAALPLDLRQGLETVVEKCVIGASSQMERFFHRELRRRGLQTIPNFKLGPYRWDVGIEDATVVIDLNSYLYHNENNGRTFIIDRWKANHAEMSGWGHLEFTDACLNDVNAKRLAIKEVVHLVAHRRQTGPGTPVEGRVEVGPWLFHDQLRHQSVPVNR